MCIQNSLVLSFCFFLLSISLPVSAQTENLTDNPEIQKFIDEMVKEHQFKKKELQTLFNQVEVKQKILDAISRPAEKSKPWFDYRKIFLTDKRIQGGVSFWQQHADILEYAEKIYGVPAEIIVAIIGVETYYGRLQGSHRVMDALTTLGFFYPPRSAFFLGELKQFLIMSKEQNFDPLSKKGSYAGAMGMGQFIPSSYQHYAIDFNGDGVKNIWENHADAIGSVANYFKRHGWKKDQPVADKVSISLKNSINPELACKRSCKPKKTVADFKRDGIKGKTSVQENNSAILLILKQKTGDDYWLGYNNFYVISRYNHSTLYSMAVYQLSQEIKNAYQTANRKSG
jgi:membrane-bound lytic murein transglycosylase B